MSDPRKTSDPNQRTTDAPDLTPHERLEHAHDRLVAVESRIDDRGGDVVEAAADAYRNAATLLDNYVDRATGTGRDTFRAYVQLEGQFATLVENLPDGLDESGREAFEEAFEAIDKRRLRERDFERARDALEPAETYAALLTEREAARDELTEARKAARRRLREVEAAIDERDRLRQLATADLDAPVERLREPIERYNAAIREAFEEYRHSVSAREVFALLERSQWYPFVDFERPPAELEAYVAANPAGEYTIPELLEYATYSRSKLSHYVDDADELKRRVATQQTSLEGIDAEPLTIDWPPEPAPVTRRRTRELIPLVARVADEGVVAALREVRALTRADDYDRLQTAAQAREQVRPEERELLLDGRVDEQLESLRQERERLQTALEKSEPN